MLCLPDTPLGLLAFLFLAEKTPLPLRVSLTPCNTLSASGLNSPLLQCPWHTFLCIPIPASYPCPPLPALAQAGGWQTNIEDNVSASPAQLFSALVSFCLLAPWEASHTKQVEKQAQIWRQS